MNDMKFISEFLRYYTTRRSILYVVADKKTADVVSNYLKEKCADILVRYSKTSFESKFGTKVLLAHTECGLRGVKADSVIIDDLVSEDIRLLSLTRIRQTQAKETK